MAKLEMAEINLSLRLIRNAEEKWQIIAYQTTKKKSHLLFFLT